MLTLSDAEHEILARIIRAGSIELGPACPLSTAIRLQLAGLVTITESRPQHAVATRRGSAFQYRGAA